MPLVELPGFEEHVRRHTWQGSRALVRRNGPRPCPRCNAGLVVRINPVIQPALFHHGGYGAAERRTVDVCLACAGVSVARLETLNPRRLDAR